VIQKLILLTIFIDDAGSGDLLFGVVIGAYNPNDDNFRYDVIDVKYFQAKLFQRKEYLNEATRIVFSLLSKMKVMDTQVIFICQGYIFDKAVNELRKRYGDDHVQKLRILGKPQEYVERAYLDELRNLGYTPLKERQKKRAKSFFHMMRWLKKNPEMLQYAKTGWPRLSKYHLFTAFFHNERRI
jgi:hypothetical protein